MTLLENGAAGFVTAFVTARALLLARQSSRFDVHCSLVFARFALLVAPSDPMVSTAPARHEALGWLRNQVAPRGFQVAIVGGGGSPLADLEPIAAKMSPGDSVLVHVSARLVTGDSIALSAIDTPIAALHNREPRATAGKR